eukprot:CAMPEP_0182447148 /NCGR_PEP_ID=MMETSP1172-20130603/12019_1 /TAXON_ID=708627 /ORGANISM="Timspurckia oligopyrenoides, Strain CCMP3278" /LENGTH=851 /DNA_ID=CAMNT_0024643465 /DNA_START=16 /DNA_END=2571 /DNA_ORIENTATION=+
MRPVQAATIAVATESMMESATRLDTSRIITPDINTNTRILESTPGSSSARATGTLLLSFSNAAKISDDKATLDPDVDEGSTGAEADDEVTLGAHGDDLDEFTSGDERTIDRSRSPNFIPLQPPLKRKRVLVGPPEDVSHIPDDSRRFAAEKCGGNRIGSVKEMIFCVEDSEPFAASSIASASRAPRYPASFEAETLEDCQSDVNEVMSDSSRRLRRNTHFDFDKASPKHVRLSRRNSDEGAESPSVDTKENEISVAAREYSGHDENERIAASPSQFGHLPSEDDSRGALADESGSTDIPALDPATRQAPADSFGSPNVPPVDRMMGWQKRSSFKNSITPSFWKKRGASEMTRLFRALQSPPLEAPMIEYDSQDKFRAKNAKSSFRRSLETLFSPIYTLFSPTASQDSGTNAAYLSSSPGNILEKLDMLERTRVLRETSAQVDADSARMEVDESIDETETSPAAKETETVVYSDECHLGCNGSFTESDQEEAFRSSSDGDSVDSPVLSIRSCISRAENESVFSKECAVMVNNSEHGAKRGTMDGFNGAPGHSGVSKVTNALTRFTSGSFLISGSSPKNESNSTRENVKLREHHRVSKRRRDASDEEAVENAESRSVRTRSRQNVHSEVAFDPFTFIATLPPLESITNRPPVCIPSKHIGAPRITLVLDLDETLVHCSTEPLDRADISFIVCFRSTEYKVYARRRPHLERFLAEVSRVFEVVIFTASHRVYCDRLLDLLDPDKRFVRFRVYRQSCVSVGGNYLKDLTVLGRDLRSTVIVDNSPQAFGFHVENGIPIATWTEDQSDCELLNLLPVLMELKSVPDVRPFLRSRYGLHKKVQDGANRLREQLMDVS